MLPISAEPAIPLREYPDNHHDWPAGSRGCNPANHPAPEESGPRNARGSLLSCQLKASPKEASEMYSMDTFDMTRYNDFTHFRTVTARQLTEIEGIAAIRMHDVWNRFEDADKVDGVIVARFASETWDDERRYSFTEGVMLSPNDKIEIGVVD